MTAVRHAGFGAAGKRNHMVWEVWHPAARAVPGSPPSSTSPYRVPASPLLLLFSVCWSGVALPTCLAVSPCSCENVLDLRMQILFKRHTNVVSFATELPKLFTCQAVCSGFVFQFLNANFMPGCTVHSCVFVCVVSKPCTPLGVQFHKSCRFPWISRGLCLWGK